VIESALFWAAVGGMVPPQFLVELLNKYTVELQYDALTKQDSEGYTNLMIAISWSCSPEVIRLLVERCPHSLLIRDKAGNDCLKLARFAKQPNPRNPSHRINTVTNIALLTKLMSAYKIHLMQRNIVLSVFRQKDHPSILSTESEILVKILIDAHNHEPGILDHIVSYVGLDQRAYEELWWRDEIIEKTRKIGYYERIIEKLSEAIEKLSEAIVKLTRDSAGVKGGKKQVKKSSLGSLSTNRPTTATELVDVARSLEEVARELSGAAREIASVAREFAKAAGSEQQQEVVDSARTDPQAAVLETARSDPPSPMYGDY
jgi:hypothetical protein